MTTAPAFAALPKITPITLTHSNAANALVTAATAGSAGMKVLGLFATNTDSANAYLVQVWLTRSATAFLLGSVNVPLSSGNTSAAVAIDLLAGLFGLPHDNDGQRYLVLENGDTLQVSATTQVATSQTLTIVSIAGNF